MSLTKTYKEYILEQILLAYLKDGEIPTPDALEKDLIEYQEFHTDLSLPKSKYIEVTVGHGAHSSASKMEEIADTFSSDVSVISREIMKLAKDSSSYYERWINELKKISNKANKLEQKLNGLLLLANNTEGYFAHVGDTLSDLSLVDTEQTTAYINVQERSCSIDPDSSNISSKQLNLNNLTEAEVSFSPITRRTGTAYFSVNEKNSPVQIFKPNGDTWVGKITCAVAGPMTAEMKIKLTDSEAEVSKISFIYSGPDLSGKSTVTAQYSLDGYIWSLLPTSEATKMLIGNMSWHFNLTKMKWLKFIFYKPVADEGKYEYIYSASSIKVFGNSYSTSAGNVFVSKALSSADESENLRGFSSCRLEACENIAENTAIHYSVSASRDGVAWTDWTRISPSSEEGLLYPKIVSFAGLSLKDNTSDSTTPVFSSTGLTKPQMRNVTKFDEDFIPYSFKDKSFGVLNTSITYTENPNVISNNITLWRNIRLKDSFPDRLKVRNAPRGWGLEGKTYYCYFEITNPKGKSFDFGNTSCFVDSTPITGIKIIPKGIHKFETSQENWFDIVDSLPDGVITKEEDLVDVDPLYPYNHKLIIEGIKYATVFSGEKKYIGTDLSAQFYSTKTSLFDLENNIDGFGSFAVRGIGNEEESIYSLGVFLKYDNSNPDHVNELSITRWKSDESGQGLFKYIKLKAELITSNSYFTPQLTAYRLELGN